MWQGFMGVGLGMEGVRGEGQEHLAEKTQGGRLLYFL